MTDYRKIKEVLDGNKDKPFVKRILDPIKYPVLKNPDGTVSTHSMAWGDEGGRYFVYPTVVQGPDGKLLRLPDDAAWRRAKIQGDRIEFKTPEDADDFSKNYKMLWGGRVPTE